MKTTLFTGHSLGGGLAACAGTQNPNTTAITFDAPLDRDEIQKHKDLLEDLR